MDDFRYALKKVQRIDIEMTFEEVSPPFHLSDNMLMTG